MFDSTNPPLLVMPMENRFSSLFPQHEGYTVHTQADGRVLVSFKDGWTFPLSPQQQRFITVKPLLLLINKGRITSEGSTYVKGYAHQFCANDGSELVFKPVASLFPDQPGAEWMLAGENTALLWLQYGFKNQYLGESGFMMEKHYYGKLIISRLSVLEDSAPRLDKNADIPGMRFKQYRVNEQREMYEDWSLVDEDPEYYLLNKLEANGLKHYSQFLKKALTTASTSR